VPLIINVTDAKIIKTENAVIKLPIPYNCHFSPLFQGLSLKGMYRIFPLRRYLYFRFFLSHVPSPISREGRIQSQKPSPKKVAASSAS
jgi:hypothetical protein